MKHHEICGLRVKFIIMYVSMILWLNQAYFGSLHAVAVIPDWESPKGKTGLDTCVSFFSHILRPSAGIEQLRSDQMSLCFHIVSLCPSGYVATLAVLTA
jgi:hypothetical protein